jgi:hypothetical protein
MTIMMEMGGFRRCCFAMLVVSHFGGVFASDRPSLGMSVSSAFVPVGMVADHAVSALLL